METKKENIELLDDELYNSIFGRPRVGDFEKIWERIKTNPKFLTEAVEIVRDKFDERDILKGIAIADAMLIDYEAVDALAYNKLIDIIFKSEDIARLVVRGASNGGYSFLLMALWNDKLKLTEEQKNFAVKEAMNKIGTVKWYEQTNEITKQYEEMGEKEELHLYEEVNILFSSLSRKQAHGVGAFDIRYFILRNPNWSIEEKKKLIMDFWYDDDEYDNALEEWEWDIINDKANYKGYVLPMFDKESLYSITYDKLLEFYDNDKETADRIWKKINFCRSMHELRPQQWEMPFVNVRKEE